MENIKANLAKKNLSDKSVELEFFSTHKYHKFYIYQKDKVVSEYYHTLLLKEWIAYKKRQDKWIKDSLYKKICDKNLFDIEITYNKISFVNDELLEFYQLENVENLIFDSFESTIYYLANILNSNESEVKK